MTEGEDISDDLETILSDADWQSEAEIKEALEAHWESRNIVRNLPVLKEVIRNSLVELQKKHRATSRESAPNQYEWLKVKNGRETHA